MTIYDVSEKAGVSIATVSRVLNGSENVSAETRKKVLAVIEACDYTPNAFARGLGLNSMNTIGILCADSSDLYLANAVYHIEQELRANNYNCILCCTGYKLEDKKKYLNLLVNKKVDSVVLVGSNFISDKDEENDYIRDAARDVPILLLNADFDCENVYCSLCDDFKSTMQATSYILDTGIEDILYLYNSKSYSAMRKLSGYQSALTQHGIALRMEYMQFFPGSHANLPAIADFLANLDPQIKYRAVIAADDNLAIGAIKYAHKKGVTNVYFLLPINKLAIPNLLKEMDVLYIGLQKQSLFRFGISPNKMFDYMMAAKPIIQAIDAGNNLVREADCGIDVEPDNVSEISKAILALKSMSEEERRKLGENGKKFVLSNHTYQVLGKRFLDIMNNLIEK